MATSQTGRRLGGAVYILPNLLTTGNLFFGFFSIIKSLQGQFSLAAIAISLAAIFDVLDGRVARLTRGTSEFGVQYDSLCDLCSFGVAPAFMMYQYGLHSLGRVGWVVCFIFLACGALRLARFNVQSSIGKANGDFTGLPIPMAALVVASFVAFVEEIHSGEAAVASVPIFLWLEEHVLNRTGSSWFLLIAGVVLGLAMVSNVRYRSHKAIRISAVKPFRLLVIAVLVLGLVAYYPEAIGFLLLLLYSVSGPFEWIAGWKKASDDDEIFSPEVHEEEDSAVENNSRIID